MTQLNSELQIFALQAPKNLISNQVAFQTNHWLPISMELRGFIIELHVQEVDTSCADLTMATVA